MSGAMEVVMLSRPVRVVQIPEGDETTLDPGQPLTITQALGGSFTVMTQDNRRFRLEGTDADAIGKSVPEEARPLPGLGDAPLEPDVAREKAWELLKSVHDPEIPINVVDLGLIYDLEVHRRGDGRLLAVVRMTLTAPGCGMGDFLIQDVERQLKRIPGVETVDAKIVFDPVWNPYTMMSEAARLQLGMM